MFATRAVVLELLLAVVVFIGRPRAVTAALGSYGADSSKVSVSGVSSGAHMAVQLHVAYSSTFMGVGAVAGGPYYCAQGLSYNALYGKCSHLGNPAQVSIAALKAQTESYASSGKVDATSNMGSDKVYIFSGTSDSVVQPALVVKLEDYYKEFIPAGNIESVYTMAAGHAFITENSGSSCGSTQSPYINQCNYNQAYAILNHIYGNLQQPTSSTTLNGQLLEFSQWEFFPSYWPIWPLLSIYRPMATNGFVYIPSGCASAQSNCKLHVALHGCSQTILSVGDDFYTMGGYSEVGEENDIIILYPQAMINTYLLNALGCWDWWGYTGSSYATNTGWEMKAIKAMVDRILQ